MEFVKILHYVENSYKGRPSFVILMSDGKEYISSRCVFVENTEDNIKILIAEYDCKDYIDELLSSDSVELKDITDTTAMFRNCKTITKFTDDLSHITVANKMFRGCHGLKEFDSKLSSLPCTTSMFSCCYSLETFKSDLSNVKKATAMFMSCGNLNKFVCSTRNIEDTEYMFSGCDKLKYKGEK